ncbi:MAG: hypothetical protein ACK4HV_03815 [Parachlamydiaceae bacterium]
MYSTEACTSTYSTSSQEPLKQTEKQDRIDTVTTVALAILVIGVIAVALSTIIHPVLLVPGALVAFAGGGIFLFSFEAPRTFVSTLPSNFATHRPVTSQSAISVGGMARPVLRGAATVYPAPRPPFSSNSASASVRGGGPSGGAFVSTGGFGGFGVFGKREA